MRGAMGEPADVATRVDHIAGIVAAGTLPSPWRDNALARHPFAAALSRAA